MKAVMMRRGWWGSAMLAMACSSGGTGSGLQPFDPDSGTSTGEVGDDGDDGAPTESSGEGTYGGLDSADDDGGGSTDDGDTGGSTDGGSSTGVQDDCPRVEVMVGGGLTLNVRPDPSTTQAPIGSLTDGTIVDVLDEATGEDVDGNSLWYQISTGSLEGWVSAVFAVCTRQEPPDISDDGYYLPLQCGVMATCSPGQSHQKLSDLDQLRPDLPKRVRA